MARGLPPKERKIKYTIFHSEVKFAYIRIVANKWNVV